MIRYDFTGKVALVTGSSRGIGVATLTAFAKAGATGVLHFWDDPDGGNRRDAEALAKALGGAVHLEPADVREAGEVEAMMQRVKVQFGGLDILVNNAGIIRDRTLKKMTLDEWHAVLQTNLTGVFHCCKYGADILRDGGRIVNIASIAGLLGFHGQTNYAAAKAGVMGLTRVLAKELARRRIAVNAVAPGVIQTAMLGEVKADVQAEYLKQIPVGRLGKPEDVANAILFLATEESEYITGHVLPVTGGWA
ncbi:3-oxoacyl-ACP reductase FabG [Limnoglobus roseus]|uniref:3-oxoacyl-ACP reductase FabG n=1 Tax=Limnoglobus roseus TaxID=2598579 RepID=A0A5C1ABP1_9BACT|nr:3-oxoacyl-ACP reductase FabG [Limnoglobus roseus]QEL16005.1 3-oxoacyl-ACP reductase FabG [Limnoglobus roseus]